MSHQLYKELDERYAEHDGDFTDLLRGYGNDDIKNFEHIQHEGGGEGGAQDCESIIKVDDQYYSITYTYMSYDGFDFDYAEAFKVTPKEKTITVYE